MRIATLLIFTLISGCAYNVTLMPRDSGATYTGEFMNNGSGSGTMTVRLGSNTCTGPVAKVASNESFGFANTYGRNSRGQSANAFTTVTTSGDVTVKAILSCTDGGGLRCDMTGRDSSGGGICLDDRGRVYDAIAIRK